MKLIQLRLSIMMFLQFFTAGCIMPVFSLYLKQDLNFTGTQIGLILAMSAVPSFLSPVIGAFVADRLISAERLLSICHFAGAAVMGALFMQKTFYPVLFFYLLYGLIAGPTFGLTTAITFHHSTDGTKTFGGIRLWGTLGWFTAAWVFSFFCIDSRSSGKDGDLHNTLLLAALTLFLSGIYSMTLPVGLKRKNDRVALIPKDSLSVMVLPDILILSVLCLVITFVDRFYTFGGAPYLKSLGFSDK
ncbi:MAG: nucleoside permease, partial [Fibrobacter sp.]|nr:nucleoside permease [Fibrobacter sp.]